MSKATITAEDRLDHTKFHYKECAIATGEEVGDAYCACYAISRFIDNKLAQSKEITTPQGGSK